MFNDVSYMKNNSRASFYSWLKGFSDTSNYDRKISKQSYDTNFGTPFRNSLLVGLCTSDFFTLLVHQRSFIG